MLGRLGVQSNPTTIVWSENRKKGLVKSFTHQLLDFCMIPRISMSQDLIEKKLSESQFVKNVKLIKDLNDS